MGMKLAVILGVMAGAFLLEVVLPLVRMVLRKRREAREAVVGTQSAGGAGPDALQPAPNADSLNGGCGAQGTARPTGDDEPIADGHPSSADSDEAQRLWEEARAMPHQEVSDFSTDWQYMTLLHKAAKLGHAEACSKIGDYAYRRGALIEAFFWKWKAEADGGRCAEPSLEEVRVQCLASGALAEPGEMDGSYGIEEDDFARAVIAVQSGMSVATAMQRLKELAECGVEEAQLFLARR